MTLREVRPTGQPWLEIASRLLQSARLAEPFGGLWEAADLQWWWRLDQPADPDGQSIWMEESEPVVAVAFSRWKDWIGCDLLGTDAAVAKHADRLWARVQGRVADQPVSMIIRDDDAYRIAVAERSGFVAGDDTYATAWMAADDRPAVPQMPPRIRVQSYGGGAHPMVARSGPRVAERLAECPLYRPDLDLAVVDGGSVVGYALFWADPVTGVGLLEPMRIEASHQGRGLSRVLIAAGLDGLAAAGCTRLKVTFDPSNEPAARLYTGAGYRVRSCPARGPARHAPDVRGAMGRPALWTAPRRPRYDPRKLQSA